MSCERRRAVLFLEKPGFDGRNGTANGTAGFAAQSSNEMQPRRPTVAFHRMSQDSNLQSAFTESRFPGPGNPARSSQPLLSQWIDGGN